MEEILGWRCAKFVFLAAVISLASTARGGSFLFEDQPRAKEAEGAHSSEGATSNAVRVGALCKGEDSQLGHLTVRVAPDGDKIASRENGDVFTVLEVGRANAQKWVRVTDGWILKGLLQCPSTGVPWPKEEETAEQKRAQSAPAAANSLEARCDELAASKYDNDRPSSVAGAVSIATKDALEVCKEAVTKSPELRRLRIQLARAYHYSGDLRAAYQQALSAATLGSVRAVSFLAFLHQLPEFGRDYTTARQYAELAADRNDPQAHILLGNIYLNGLNVVRDPAKANDLYKKGGSLGDEKGYFELAQNYQFGIGTAVDYAKAREFFLKAEGTHGMPDSEPRVEVTMDFITANVRCRPNDTTVRQREPYQHIVLRSATENFYTGTAKTWRLVENVSASVYNESTRYSWPEDMVSDNKIVFSRSFFKDLSASVKTDGSSLILKCAKPDCFLQTTYYKTMDGPCGKRNCQEKLSEQYYRFCSNIVAEQVGRAIVHLIKLNGGREDPF